MAKKKLTKKDEQAKAVDMSKCDTPTVITNPSTGNVAIIFVWIIGIMTFGYTIWYFKKVSSMN